MFSINSRKLRLAILGVIIAGIAVGQTISVFRAAALADSLQQPASQPGEVVQQTIHQAIALIRDDSLPERQRRRELIALVQGRFDFSEMARSALGRHWKTLSDDQRQQFVTVFIAFLEDAYIGKVENYAGQPIQFANETQLDSDDVEVATNILQSQGDPVQVNYLMRQEGGEWKVYDVTVDSISIIANYRNQFNRVINDKGFPALMSAMREKQKHLEATI